MAAPEHRRERRWFGRGRTRALLSVGILLGFGAVATSAYWTDRGKVTGTSFSSGALHIDLPGFNQVRGETYTWSGLSLSNLTPGTSKSATIVVSKHSIGDVTFSHRVRATATNVSGNLAGALTVTVQRGGTSNGTTCTGGAAVGAAGSALLGFDQPAGANLGPAQSHTICVQVTLPSAATVTAGSQADLTFTFPATQVP